MIKIVQFLVLLLYPCLALNAQIDAIPNVGCAPLTGVQFTHSFTNASDIVWLFGDGTSASLQSPSHTYTNPGNYIVSFSAIVNGQPVTAQTNVTVYGNPVASFNLDDLGGCVGSEIVFNSTSIGGGGSAIQIWQWSFGDGGTNTTNTGSPAYSYQVPGNYDISLTVTDANGCVGTVTVPQAVGVSEAPTVQFTTNPSPATSCLPPLNVSFTNQSSGVGMTYEWDFGNGTQSVLQNPSNANYNAEGNYLVTLTGTDANNCSISQQVGVSIGQPVAGIEILDAQNDTVCPSVSFVNTSTGGSMFIIYGDGSSGGSLNHVYGSGGWYTATLVTSAGSCNDQASVTFFVEYPVASFDLDPAIVFCSSPVEMQAIDLSVNAAEYEWILGADTFVVQEPFFSVPIGTPDEFAITSLLEIEVFLTVHSIHGCMSTASEMIGVHLPTALHYPDTIEGCLPLPVVFTDYSTSEEEIISWTWNLGDGTIIVSETGDDVEHIYTQPGEYWTTLIIENAFGCRDTSFAHHLFVGENFELDFAITPELLCPGETALFENTTLISSMDSIDFWEWTGDPSILTEAGFGPYTYGSPGIYEYTWLAGYNGCYDENEELLFVKGGQCSPSDGDGFGCYCDNPFLLEMQLDTAGGVLNWDIDFGDGTLLLGSTDLTPSHTYEIEGVFLVTITTYSLIPGIPPSAYTFDWNTHIASAQIDAEPLNCVGLPVNFDASGSVDVALFCNYGYQWDWGDHSPLYHSDNAMAQHVYTETGFYDVILYTTNAKGCQDTAMFTVHIVGVEAGIDANISYGCFPLDIEFMDISVADLTLVSWEWEFDDDTFSTVQDPFHTFEENSYSGSPYQVTLTATDELGCIGTTTYMITPLIPPNGFTASPVQLCVGSSSAFTTSVNADFHDFQWTFSNGDTSNEIAPEIVFDDPGFYSATLTVIDSVGCESNLELLYLIEVQAYPEAGFSSSADLLENLCYPILLEFTDTSTVEPFGDRSWDLGLGGFTIGAVTVGTTFSLPGEYDVQLIEETTFGCADTAIQTYIVEGPLAEFTVNDDLICKGDEIEFTLLDTMDVAIWSFDFGDGSDTSNVGQVIHTYDFHPPGGQTIASLTIWSQDSTCAATRDTVIFIHQVIADMTLNDVSWEEDTTFCFVNPLSLSDNSSNANTWVWEIQGDQYSGTLNPPFSGQAGSYEIVLEISNSVWGCVDSIYRQIEILPLPPAQASGGEGCLGDPIQLFASGGDYYAWTPLFYLDDSTISSPISTAEQSLWYTVLVTDTNGCFASVNAFVDVVLPAPVVEFDTTIVIGISVDYIDVSVYQGIYSWTPSDWLSCSSCPDPVFQPLEDITYEVVIEDSLGCFEVSQYYTFTVLPYSSADVPDIFSPNGDGVNDIIYVKGLGIKELLSFEIYNRWGEMVFQTSDITKGWDGSYKGIIQNSDTYTYIVSVANYISDKPLEIRGHLSLIK